jgi:transposase
MVDWSFKKSGTEKEKLLFIFEHTGLYSDILVAQPDERGYTINVVSGLEIKPSLGIFRGKEDRAKAKRIAL